MRAVFTRSKVSEQDDEEHVILVAWGGRVPFGRWIVNLRTSSQPCTGFPSLLSFRTYSFVSSQPSPHMEPSQEPSLKAFSVV